MREMLIISTVRNVKGVPVIFYRGDPVPVPRGVLRQVGWYPGAQVVARVLAEPLSFDPNQYKPVKVISLVEVLEPPIIHPESKPVRRYYLQSGVSPDEGVRCVRCGAIRRFGETGWYAIRDREQNTTMYMCPSCGWKEQWTFNKNNPELVPVQGPDYVVVETILRRNVRNTYGTIPPYCYADPRCTRVADPASHLVYWLRTRPGTKAAERRLLQEEKYAALL